ncbi:hypothetical protein SAY86_015797 [Trapa natans]|uniref:Uncharacterized protein n=1 Tax=Trapa natans TaxID=22666 RepID=A0AAN7LB50_TRANT|nr:hypothetical protein SAY86_015797 [Trapa natans]
MTATCHELALRAIQIPHYHFLLGSVDCILLQLQGVGGIIELAPGYLPAVYSTIKKAGGLCTAGEVRAGFLSSPGCP